MLSEDRTGKEPLTNVMAQVLIREAYDKDFGLNTGYYGVGMCEEEKLSKGSLLEYWSGEYLRCRIWEVWHINVNEFISKPRYEMKMLCDLALERDAEDLNSAKALQRKLENQK